MNQRLEEKARNSSSNTFSQTAISKSCQQCSYV